MTRTEFELLLDELIEIANKEDVYYIDVDDLPIKLNEVASGLDVETHRWYEISTTVYQAGEWFIGISQVTNTFSESTGINDCAVKPKVFEMIPVQVISYIRKK